MRLPAASISTGRKKAEKVLKTVSRFFLYVSVLVIGYYAGRPVFLSLESGVGALLTSFNNAATQNPGLSDDASGADSSSSDFDISNLTPEQKAKLLEFKKKLVEQGSPQKPAAPANASFAKGVRQIIHEGRPLAAKLKHDIWAKPASPEVPAKEEFALRKEMVDFRAKDNIIVVTFANFAFMDFVITWVRHLTDNGVFNILVGAMDTQVLEGLYLEGVPVFDMESGMSTVDVGWGTPIFHKMGREKITLINVFLSMNFEILICDTDMVWLRNPLPWIARWPYADVLTSSDETIRTVDDDGLEKWDRAWASYNIGILLYRPTEAAKKQAREWAELLHSDSKIWDQNGFNDLMRKKLGPSVEAGDGLVWAYDGKLKLGIMPVSLFCSGHTFFVQRLYKLVGLPPFAVHTTFQFGGTPGKRHRLRDAKLFMDKPEYYSPSNGVLSFDLPIPEAILSEGEHTLESHFALVNYQLVRIRTGLALASMLNRSLVFPEMWCRFDRMWYPIPGKLPGTATPQPLNCPLDHVFSIERMFERYPQEEFGPFIDFRESSFLANPRLPAAFKKSTVSVQVCLAGGAGPCPDVPAPPAAEGATVKLAANSTQAQIVAALEPLKDVRVLHFPSMDSVLGEWSDRESEKKFIRRIGKFLGIWCCVSKTPGHVWYDFFWDKKPNWRPQPPQNWTVDHQPEFLVER